MKMKRRYKLTESQLNKVIQNKVKQETLNEDMKGFVAGSLMALASLVAQGQTTIDKAADILSKNDNIEKSVAKSRLEKVAANFEDEYKPKYGETKRNMPANTDDDLARIFTTVGHGYAIKEIHLDTIINTVPSKVVEQKVDSSTIEIDGTNMYEQGSFTLTSEAKQHIQQKLDSMDGLIVGITVESSTDKQRVSPRLQHTLGDDPHHYSADNKGLSQDRNDGMVDYLGTIIDCKLVIDQDVKWEQGTGEVGAETPQDASARYVKIHVYFVNIPADVPTDSTTEVIIKTIFELAKPKSKLGKTPPPIYNLNKYKGNTCPNPNKTNKNVPHGSQLMKTKWKNPQQRKMGGATQMKPFHGRR